MFSFQFNGRNNRLFMTYSMFFPVSTLLMNVKEKLGKLFALVALVCRGQM